jgi:hypothetical protein
LKKRIIVIALVLLALTAGYARADKIHDELMKLREKAIQLQNGGEFGFRHFTPCTEIKLFGDYKPTKAEVKKGGALLVYFEPANYFTKKEDGKYRILISEDMLVTTKDGKVLLDQKNATTLSVNSETPVMDVFFRNTVNLGGSAPGTYIFKAVIHDKLRNKTATRTLEFKITE